MKSKAILCLALVLCGGLIGCSSVNDRPAAMSDAVAVGTFISDIHMSDARNGWAWTSASGVEYKDLPQHTLLLHTSDGGRTWQDRTPRGFSYSTESSYFLDPQTAWVFTRDRTNYHGGLLRTTDGGKSWSVLIQPGAAAYGCLTENSDSHLFNAKDGVVNTADYSAGSVHVCFYDTHDGGRNWKPVVIIPPGGAYSNEPPGTISLSDITPEKLGYCPPANVVITHGDMDDEIPKDGVRLSVSTNLGKSWRDVKLPLPSEKYRDGLARCETPVFLDGKNGWLPANIFKWNTNGTLAWNVEVFYATHDGGETWTPRPGIIEGGTNQIGRQFNVVSARDIFVGVGTNLFATHDDAQSWQTIKPNLDFGWPSSSDGVSQIDFVDARHGWAVAHDSSKDSPQAKYHLYKTSDGGVTWTELPLKIMP